MVKESTTYINLNNGEQNTSQFNDPQSQNPNKLKEASWDGGNHNPRFLIGATMYIRLLSSGGYLYKDYHLSFRAPCKARATYFSFNSWTLTDLQGLNSSTDESIYKKDDIIMKGELVSLHKTRYLGQRGGEQNFCGGGFPAGKLINQPMKPQVCLVLLLLSVR